MKEPRKYWLVKHGLDSLTALPRWIWRTGKKKGERPRSFGSVRKGDRWIGFAYADTDSHERRLSLVTGFYECVDEACYRRIPEKGLKITGNSKNAWMIEGSPLGWQPDGPVAIPPIEQIMGRKTFRQSALIEVSKKEFAAIVREAKMRLLKPSKIPLLGRNPRNEQEVLALVVAGREKLGIENFVRIRTGFPDMLVKLKGRSSLVHLELELYSKSFLTHGHAAAVKKGGGFADADYPGCPVGVLCWVKDIADKDLKKQGKVEKVFELQELLRDSLPIKWRR